jgi:RND family efflux transporter MFP subunit
MWRFLKTLIRRTLPLVILGGGIAVYIYLHKTAPTAERRTPPVPLIEVEAVRLHPEDYRIALESQGTVKARTESTLIPEVSGRVLRIAPNFREGGFFEEGDILLEIDPSDYETAVIVAESALAEARVRLAEEEAQAVQARLDWERLGGTEVPPELVLREPQLALAQARLRAAEANLETARGDLESTRIRAPYAGRVLRKRADVGQVVAPGTVMAEIYAVDYAEIRLPLTMDQYAMLDIDNGDARHRVETPSMNPVTLSARFGPDTITWEGRIVRVEGAVDTRSRQFYVVVQVNDPYGEKHAQPLKVGLFVEATVRGKLLKDVYRLPRTALREDRFVLTLDDEKRIQRVEIVPLWSDAEEVVFREEAIVPGTLVSLTQMALAIDGMQVKPVEGGQ